MPWLSLLLVAWRNAVRHVRHSFFALAAVSLGVAGLALADGFIRDMFFQLGEATVQSQLGHIQITVPGYREEGAGRPEAFLIGDSAALRAVVAADPRVSSVTGRLESSGVLTADGSELAVQIEGFEPAPRADFGGLPILLEGSEPGHSAESVASIGEGVARQLGLHAGGHVDVTAPTLDGSLNSFELRVQAVFRTFSKEFDERAVRIPLATAQELLQAGGVQTLVVHLHETAQTDAVLAALRARPELAAYEIRPWYELSEFYASTRALYARQFGILQMIALALIAMSVLTSFNITVFERTAELGTMRALGARSETVVASMALEAAFVGCVGALVGVLLAVALGSVISSIGIDMPPPPNAEIGFTARIRLEAAALLWAAAIGVGSAIVGGLLPSLRAGRMPITVALGHRI